jgi:predicted aspartyl protease
VICSSRLLFAGKFGLILGASLSLISGPKLLGARQLAAAPPATRFEALPLVRSRDNNLLVRAYINGKPAVLMVDSGCPGTMISAKRFQYFQMTNPPANWKLPARIPVNGGFNKLAVAHNLRLGALNIMDVTMVVADLGGSAEASRTQKDHLVDGILGADVLFATKAILDCQQQVLVLNMYPELAGNSLNFDSRGFHKMPLYVTEGGNSYVDSSINGTPVRLMVDTGATGTLLHRPIVRQLQIPIQQTDFQSRSINIEAEYVDVAQIRKLTVGTVSLVENRVGVANLNALVRGGLREESRPVAGLLGAEILNRHHGIIDFGTRTLYLKQEAAKSQRPSHHSPGARARR